MKQNNGSMIRGVVVDKMGQCSAKNRMNANAPKKRSSEFCGASTVNIGSMAKSDCSVNVRKRAPFGDITRLHRDCVNDDEKMQPIEEQAIASSNQKKRSRGAFESNNTSNSDGAELENSKPTKRCRLSDSPVW